MKFTAPKQGITLSAPKGMSLEVVIKELRQMADDMESRLEAPENPGLSEAPIG